jgi:hypothetical protein
VAVIKKVSTYQNLSLGPLESRRRDTLSSVAARVGDFLERPGAARPGRRLATAVALSAACLVLGGCRAVDFLNDVGEPQLDLGRMESDIRSRLQHRLESESRSTRTSVTSVGRVRCRQRSEIEARCIARVARGGDRRRLLRIDVSVDSETGAYRWEVGG